MSSTIISNHPALSNEVTKTSPPVPIFPIPPPKPIPQQGLLIQAITAHKSAIIVNGVQLKDLSVHNASGTSSADDPTSSGEFVVQGSIDLFGNKNIVAELDIWHGAPPPGVTIGSAAPSIQRAIVKGSVTLSDLIPSLGSDLSFQNVSVYHQNYLYDPTKGLGYELDADLVIDSSLGSLSSILNKVLGITDTTVHIRADFGPNQSWNGPVTANTLTVEGSFVGGTYPVTPGVNITSVGVRVILGHSPNKAATRDVEVFGTLHLAPPGGSVLPLELEYTLKDVGGVVQFIATFPSGVSWNTPMGAQGFVLDPVTFSSSLPLSDSWKGLTLDIAATLEYQTSTVQFTGSYVLGGASSLHANIQGFNLAALVQLYESVHHEPLKAPRVDVTMDSAELSIASGQGFSATLTNVSIAGHGSGNAILSFSSAGAVVQADLGNVKFGGVDIKSARIQLDLYPASSTESSEATIYGDITFESLEFQGAVHLYPSGPDVVPKQTEWTVFAELTASSNTLALSRIEPRLKGTDFDLALKDVVFIAASQDDPEVGALVTGGYQPEQGVQVFATFNEIPVFNSLANSNVAGLVLNASWSHDTGFSLNVILPVARHLTFGNGITSTPVTLSLELTPSAADKAVLVPALQVTAGLNIPVAHSPKPLLFQMILVATEIGAVIGAELKNYWDDPFGISQEVKIGPDLLLEADVTYATPPGLSGAFFRGGLAIGSTSASVAVSVNDDPMKELLSAEVDNLNFTDIVSFAEKLLHLQFPPPPSDFLNFEKVKLYMCPAGLTVQGVTYPPGFSFESDMVLFGKHIDVSCESSDSVLSINGSVDDFDLGPLKVSGTDGAKQAVVQVQVGKDIQHLLIDGAITLYAETEALHLLLNTQPSPEISFTVEFELTQLLTFKVDATLIGQLNFKDLSKADFTFDADLEQHILDYLHDEVVSLFGRAKDAAETGVAAARKKVTAEQAALDGKIDQAKAHLDIVQAAWEAHQKSVTQENTKIINDYNAKIESLQGSVASAEKAFDAALQKAQTALTNAQHDREIRMQAAQNNLAAAQQKAASDIQDARNRVAAAETKINHEFGNAEQDVNNAKNRVQGLQSTVDNISREIESDKHGSWRQKLKVPGLEIEEKSVEITLKSAQYALTVALAVLESPEYLTDKGLLAAAQRGLELAGQAGTSLIGGSQQALTGVDELTQEAINKASNALRDVQNGSEKILFNTATNALAAYKRTADSVFEKATQAIADLTKSIEYVAFETATTTLATVKSATKGLDAAKNLLSAAETGSVDILKVGKALTDVGAEAFNITSVHLSGSLGKSVGGAGLNAGVKGVVLKKSFDLSLDLNPTKVENFLTDLFLRLKDLIKADLHL